MLHGHLYDRLWKSLRFDIMDQDGGHGMGVEH